MTANYEHTRL